MCSKFKRLGPFLQLNGNKLLRSVHTENGCFKGSIRDKTGARNAFIEQLAIDNELDNPLKHKREEMEKRESIRNSVQEAHKDIPLLHGCHTETILNLRHTFNSSFSGGESKNFLQSSESTWNFMVCKIPQLQRTRFENSLRQEYVADKNELNYPKHPDASIYSDTRYYCKSRPQLKRSRFTPKS